MSNKLKQITSLAKKIRLSNPKKQWKDCIKEASKTISTAKKTPVQKNTKNKPGTRVQRNNIAGVNEGELKVMRGDKVLSTIDYREHKVVEIFSDAQKNPLYKLDGKSMPLHSRSMIIKIRKRTKK